MIFSDRLLLSEYFRGKRVAIAGSGPSILDNSPGYIDSFDVVVRVNNYKLFESTGFRTDVHYSFYGNSVRKSKEELTGDGVYLCICKCPDGKLMQSAWHAKRMKMHGVDYRYIYYMRRGFWFCETYVPTMGDFKKKFSLLGNRMPTTGFSAILDILSLAPYELYITGFDFFRSNLHNIDELWNAGDQSDPIGHDNQAEYDWLFNNHKKYPITLDSRLESIFYE